MRLNSRNSGKYEGLVEICQGQSISFWIGICHENLTITAATVICRQLGLLQNESSGIVLMCTIPLY